MNIFEELREDHDKQRTLLELVAKTSGDSEGRRELVPRLFGELRAHADAEERSFYSRLMSNVLSQDKSRHSVAEHKEMDDRVKELEEMEFTNPNWIRKFSELREKVEHHLEEEEHGVFQLGGRVLSAAEKTESAEDFRREKEKELQGAG